MPTEMTAKTKVESALSTIMRWIPEQSVEVEGPVQVAYQQALQLERIADALERVADHFDQERDEAEHEEWCRRERQKMGGV